jgi:hypothetical protein
VPAAGGLVPPTRAPPGGRGWWRQTINTAMQRSLAFFDHHVKNR